MQQLKNDENNEKLKIELEDVTAKIADLIGEENSNKIKETFTMFDQSDGTNVTKNVWKVKNKTCPKVSTSLPAVKQDVNGRLVSGSKELKELYQDHFTHRLRQRPSMDSYAELHDQQSELLRKRLIS